LFVGLAAYRQGQFDRALRAMRGDASGVLGPGPGLVIAMALHQKKQAEEARKALASAVLAYDWRENQVRDNHGCINHVLRREAEAMILPSLSAFLDGRYTPHDNAERLASLGVCQFTNRTLAAARLYADAFTADPLMAEELKAGHRSNAARAAALAGCGVGLDATRLNIAERTLWRRQAREWLRADLAACAKLLGHSTGESHALVRKLLADWKAEPDLAGLREPSAPDGLSTEERNECLALWQAVDNVLTRAREPK
jgi:serine/threonine-protein kinase